MVLLCHSDYSELLDHTSASRPSHPDFYLDRAVDPVVLQRETIGHVNSIYNNDFGSNSKHHSSIYSGMHLCSRAWPNSN